MSLLRVTGHALSLVLILVVRPSCATDCSNTCEYASDGLCNDGGPGSAYFDCGQGTDCADCGPRNGASSPSASAAPPPLPPPVACSDTCEYASDGLCNDGGPGSANFDCAQGTDCADCGPRYGVSLPPSSSGTSVAQPLPPSPPRQATPDCMETCSHAGNGVCNDGGLGSAYFDCNLGTDCSDCGARYAVIASSSPSQSRPSSSSQTADNCSGMCAFGFASGGVIIAACVLCTTHTGALSYTAG